MHLLTSVLINVIAGVVSGIILEVAKYYIRKHSNGNK